MNVVITGANRGIGLELVRYYLNQGDNVFGICRNSSEELNSSGAKIVDKVDVSQLGKNDDLSKRIDIENIELLINNAGIFTNESIGSLDYNQMIKQFEVNALGPLKVTEALLSKLKSGSKIAMITSRMGSVADNGSGAYYGYRMSKAALNMASMSLAQDLKQQNIAVAILHPGMVATEMINFQGNVSPQYSATSLAERIKELTMDNTGTFWHANGQVLPW